MCHCSVSSGSIVEAKPLLTQQWHEAGNQDHVTTGKRAKVELRTGVLNHHSGRAGPHDADLREHVIVLAFEVIRGRAPASGVFHLVIDTAPCSPYTAWCRMGLVAARLALYVPGGCFSRTRPFIEG